MSADARPIGGFVVPQNEDIHVIEREGPCSRDLAHPCTDLNSAIDSSGPHMSMPSPTTSSVTAVSSTQTSVPEEPINIIFPVTVPHIDPSNNRATPRHVQEAHPFSAPRRTRQIPM